MIDLSILIVTWSTRELLLRCLVRLPTAYVVRASGASGGRKDPALTRIEYHRSLYRFFLENRGLARMASVLVPRIAESLFYAPSRALLALLGGRRRARGIERRDVLLSHLRSCPASLELARAEARR